MHESWPACGGSTSVGTTRLRGAVEKSRKRAIGPSNTTSLVELHRGRRRALVVRHHRNKSVSTSGALDPRRSSPAHQSVRPSTATDHAVMPSASAISSNDGGHVPVMRLPSVTGTEQPC